MKSTREFKNIHSGDDIWVIAAGSSMNHIRPSFFENKITIGINRICVKFDCDYLLAKDGRGFEIIKDNISDKTKIILSKHESGNLYQNINKFNGECWTFEHPAKPGELPDVSCIAEDNDKIVVSYSTITSGIHMAAYMGAKNIIICGHDCGTIDGQSTIDGYYKEISPVQGSEDGYKRWLGMIENHTTFVCEHLRIQYDCNIHSLNPFINLNLEGHKYQPSNVTNILQRSEIKND